MERSKSSLIDPALPESKESARHSKLFKHNLRAGSAEAKKRRDSGWKKGVWYDFWWTFTIFWVHIGFVIWGHFFYQESNSYWENFGFRILASATDCNSLSQLRTGLSFLFNILAAILPIFAGNTLLALASPTRKQLDECHESGQYMDIGTHSFSNIRKPFIPWKQKILWGILALLTLPFHVL